MPEIAGRGSNTTPDERSSEAALRDLLLTLASATELPDLAPKAVTAARDATGSSGAFMERVISSEDGVEVVGVAGEGTPPLGARSKYSGAIGDEAIRRSALVVPLRAG